MYSLYYDHSFNNMPKDDNQKPQTTSNSIIIMTTVRVTDIIKPFNREEYVVAWVKKLNLVTELKKVPDLPSFLPF